MTGEATCLLDAFEDTVCNATAPPRADTDSCAETVLGGDQAFPGQSWQYEFLIAVRGVHGDNTSIADVRGFGSDD